MSLFAQQMKRLRKNESGSFTLEASLLFPIILILTICLLFFSLVIYEKVVLHQRAQLIADRMAYVWNNSTKNPVTGAFSIYTSDVRAHDGLYWRITGNNFLSKLGLNLGENDGLVNRKTARARTGWMSSGSTEKVSYHNTLAGGYITVRLKEPLNFPASVEKVFGLNQVSTTAKASVNDPVEFIRNTDFVFHYAQQLLKKSNRSPKSAIRIFANR